MLSFIVPFVAAALADSACATPRQAVDTLAAMPAISSSDTRVDAPCISLALTMPAVDTTTPRRRAVQVSDAYARRLTIHRYASYTLPPLFIGQYLLGNKLIHQKEDVFAGRRNGPPDASLRHVHVATAIGVGTLFTVNTITGLWNLHDSWGNKEGRKLRTAHALLMLASDAGFAATGVVGHNAVAGNLDDARRHRTIAVSSMGVAAVAAGLMWFRK
jgi:hypothetical protein